MTTERIEAFYRDATAADVLRVVNGEKVEARFQDQKNYCWFYSNLSGWRNGPFPWGDEALCFWNFCQVYDPPQWFRDKPEPGEGYRLLNKFPAEDLQPGDAFFENNQWWPVSLESPCPQVRDVWYRRRIEQPKPEPKFAVGQRVKIVGPRGNPRTANGWNFNMDGLIGTTKNVESFNFLGVAGWFYGLAGDAVHVFREDYLEAVIEPKPEPKHYVLQFGDTISVPSGRQAIVTELGIEVQ